METITLLLKLKLIPNKRNASSKRALKTESNYGRKRCRWKRAKSSNHWHSGWSKISTGCNCTKITLTSILFTSLMLMERSFIQFHFLESLLCFEASCMKRNPRNINLYLRLLNQSICVALHCLKFTFFDAFNYADQACWNLQMIRKPINNPRWTFKFYQRTHHMNPNQMHLN